MKLRKTKKDSATATPESVIPPRPHTHGEEVGAIGGGVITYTTPQGQRVAAATGLTEVLWPTEITTANVSILGLVNN